MTRLPHVDSARLACLAAAAGFGLAVSCSGAFAQSDPKASVNHIKAVTSAVDGAQIMANTATSDDWPSRVFEIETEVAGQSALVTAEVEMVVLSPFAVCSPIA